jgi:hypothetical protein
MDRRGLPRDSMRISHSHIPNLGDAAATTEWQCRAAALLGFHVEPQRLGQGIRIPPSTRQGMSSYVPGAGTEGPQRNLALTNTLLLSLRIRQQMRKDIFFPARRGADSSRSAIDLDFGTISTATQGLRVMQQHPGVPRGSTNTITGPPSRFTSRRASAKELAEFQSNRSSAWRKPETRSHWRRRKGLS